MDPTEQGHPEERFAKAFERSPTAMTIARLPEGRFLEANDSFLAMVERRRDEVIGRTLAELGVDLMDAGARAGIRRELEQKGAVRDLEVQARTPSGRPLWLLVSVLPIDVAGEASVLTSIVDITERKGAEAALRESEERLRSFFEATSDAVFVRNAAGRIVDVNSVAVKRYGYTREELLQMFPQQLMHPDLVPRFAVLGEVALRTLLPFESRHVRKDGTDFPVEVVASAFTMHGEPCIYSSCRDISERKHAEATATELEARLAQSQKLEAVGQLAAGVAHDFNNILAAMILQLQLLKNAPSVTTEQVHEAADELLGSAERVAGLTRQLLLLGRQHPVRMVSHDLNAILTELAKLLSLVAGERVALTVVPSREPVWIQGDAAMIERVVTNLCANARDAMPDGGRLAIATSRVTVDAAWARRQPAARPGPYACLEVSDTGHGIEPSVVGRIFEPFFTTKDVGGGTGLGLATTHGIVAKHGGFIEVETEVGRGTRFCVYVPSVDPGAAGDGPDVAPPPIRGGTERILVVEDETAIRRLAVRYLEELGYRVTEAHDGVDALRIWEEQGGAFDLLFTDMVMPEGVSGLELSARLRAKKADLRTVLASGYSAELLDEDELTRRNVAYLAKPYGVTALAAAIRVCLDSPL